MAQLVARLRGTQEVTSSNLVSSTIFTLSKPLSLTIFCCFPIRAASPVLAVFYKFCKSHTSCLQKPSFTQNSSKSPKNSLSFSSHVWNVRNPYNISNSLLTNPVHSGVHNSQDLDYRQSHGLFSKNDKAMLFIDRLYKKYLY